MAVILFLNVLGGCVQFDETEKQNYEEQRTEIASADSYKTSVELTDEEKQLDSRLSELKSQYISSYDNVVPYDMRVLMGETIWNSDFYSFCKKLPKGSDLHVHGSALLPVEELIVYVKSRSDLLIGVPVVLASDDPAYQEHTMLVDDFFAAIICWDLNLAEVKQLCINSINYSGVDDMQKKALMSAWEEEWNTFVAEALKI